MSNHLERWSLQDHGIQWNLTQDRVDPHEDHLEMSGKKVSVIVSYGVNQEGKLALSRKVVWPTLRTIPNDTHGSLMVDFELESMPTLWINGVRSVNERPITFQFNGLLHIRSLADNGVIIERTLFPSVSSRSVWEKIVLTNPSDQTVSIQINANLSRKSVKGVAGIYFIEVSHDAANEYLLGPLASCQLSVRISARHLQEQDQIMDVRQEEEQRIDFVRLMNQNLRLETPDGVLNQMFAFAKLRAAESIFETKSGPMHGPGGGRYYAAIWTNDQIEYAGPFFPYLGYAFGNEATHNALRLYTAFMGPDYQPIPSSIIAEGSDIWEGAGDRGDAAMYAYGAALFALASGDMDIAIELWPAIVWCLNYCEKQKNKDGVIASDSDELEGRFPSGSANLSTSCLAYAAYVYGSRLACELGEEAIAKQYVSSAQDLYEAIERYFGARVEGFDTYRYYDGNDLLRSWICSPLVMGIEVRKPGTIAALLSPRLWSEDGLVTQAGDTTFWDRSTLYALRGLFVVGATEEAISYLLSYSRRRLLGNHVPYAVEAYPEGNQRHLSAESALYGRVITEGIFGIQPKGLSSFICKPRLPEAWDHMALRSVHVCGRELDVIVNRQGGRIELIVSDKDGFIKFEGEMGTAFEVKG
ncbi:glycosyl hydrolase family 65 protein [Paenibacillus silvestris]|nr:glycosyl hydrolase family 65 protein [Paenibacillus silvestris]